LGGAEFEKDFFNCVGWVVAWFTVFVVADIVEEGGEGYVLFSVLVRGRFGDFMGEGEDAFDVVEVVGAVVVGHVLLHIVYDILCQLSGIHFRHLLFRCS